jgi:hypothetical protein
MPVRLATGEWLKPTTEWKEETVTADEKENGIMVDKNFYITVRKS